MWGQVRNPRAVLAAVAVAVAGALTILPVASSDTALWVRGASRVDIPIAEVLMRVPPGYALQQIDYPAGLWPWTGCVTTSKTREAAERRLRAVSRRGRLAHWFGEYGEQD